MSARALVTIVNGGFGVVTAGDGSDSMGEAGRERRDRLRSAWLATVAGGHSVLPESCWPDEMAWPSPGPRWAAPTAPMHDLAVAAAVLSAYHGLPVPHNDARFIGTVTLDGRVTDGVVWMARRPGDAVWDADGDAHTITRLADLPDLMFWVARPGQYPEFGF